MLRAICMSTVIVLMSMPAAAQISSWGVNADRAKEGVYVPLSKPVRSATPQPSQYELKRSACFVRAVGKIAMVSGRDAEHPDKVERAAQGQGNAVYPCEKHRYTGDV